MTRRSQWSTSAAGRLLAAATRLLSPADRDRYREELRAEPTTSPQAVAATSLRSPMLPASSHRHGNSAPNFAPRAVPVSTDKCPDPGHLRHPWRLAVLGRGDYRPDAHVHVRARYGAAGLGGDRSLRAAGSVSAAGSIGGAVCAPQLSRLVNRVREYRVLIPVCTTFALAVAGLTAAVMLRAPDWTLFACGIAGNATMPQTGPMARARWSALLAGSPVCIQRSQSSQ